MTFKTVAFAAIAAVVATTASADKCGFMCKLAYGGGYDTVAEAKSAWEDKQKASAAAQMAATGKNSVTIGNYIYVGVAGAVSMTPIADIKGKSEAQIKQVIVEDVTEAVAELTAEELEAIAAQEAYDAAVEVATAAGATAAEAAEFAAKSAAEQAAGLASAAAFDEAAAQASALAASQAAHEAASAAASQAAAEAVTDLINNQGMSPEAAEAQVNAAMAAAGGPQG